MIEALWLVTVVAISESAPLKPEFLPQTVYHKVCRFHWPTVVPAVNAVWVRRAVTVKGTILKNATDAHSPEEVRPDIVSWVLDRDEYVWI